MKQYMELLLSGANQRTMEGCISDLHNAIKQCKEPPARILLAEAYEYAIKQLQRNYPHSAVLLY